MTQLNNNNSDSNNNNIDSFQFGVEIEMIIGRKKAAEKVASLFGKTYRDVVEYSCRYHCKAYKVADTQGRFWCFVYDGSISANYSNAKCELNTPPLSYSDLPLLQEVVRTLKRAGAFTNSSCGIHIHVDGEDMTAKGVANLVKMVNKNEDLMVKALNCQTRQHSWCAPISPSFMSKVDAKASRITEKEEIASDWYGTFGGSSAYHGDSSRYHGLNLHSLFYLGTVEFRYFNSTLHAGRVKAYVQFILGLCAKANNSKRASSKKRTVTGSEKYAFRCFLLELGLKGAEFKTARHHLLANLEGSTAWREG